jgi:hypothetical protein
VLLLTFAALGAAALFVGRVSSGAAVSFRHQIQPLFDNKCAVCHPVSYPYLDLRRGRSYDQLVGAPSELDPAYELVLPGRPELSYLLIHPPDPSNRGLLTPADRRLIAQWIREGAHDN